jgi:hypothetical protein
MTLSALVSLANTVSSTSRATQAHSTQSRNHWTDGEVFDDELWAKGARSAYNAYRAWKVRAGNTSEQDPRQLGDILIRLTT